MKRFLMICAALLSLSLLSGCMPAIVFTSPADEDFQEEFQEDWEESMDELQEDLARDWDDAWANLAENGGFSDEKDHRWRVLDAEGKELFTVTDEETVEDLDGLLRGDGWDRLAEAPSDPAYTYVYNQEKTLLAGRDPDEEREYEDLMTFTVSASEDVVTLTILDDLVDLPASELIDLSGVLIHSVAVPPETAEALRDPDQFSE